MPGAEPHASPPSRPVALAHVIEGHLESILGSAGFATAASLRRLLRFVVDETLAGRGDRIKEYSLGVSVLGKADSFDPKADPIVRVQMRRLRERLARYYANQGRNDSLVIDIPKGRYMPAFRPAAGSRDKPREEEALLVGHHAEIAALRSAFESAAAGEGRLVCLSGEPGIGKTTLVEVFLRHLSTMGVPVYVARGRCSERLVGSDAYLPVLEALEGLVRDGGGSESLRGLMMQAAPAWAVQLSPRLDEAPETGRPEDRVASTERLKRELVTFLGNLAHERPLVLFLDDLHWADPSTVDALAYAIPRWSSRRILVVGTFRPAELLTGNQAFLRVKLELQGHGVCRELPMPLLTRPDVDRYLALRFGAHRFPAELSARIHDRTEGNPLFVADLVRFLRDRGVLVESDGQWVVSGDLAQVEEDLPESIRSMVQKKIGDLTAAERRLMSAAAVLGPRFESAIVARALGVEAEEIEDRLEALDRLRGFVRRIEERILPDSTVSVEYGFVHVLYQNALHDALTPARKAALSLTLAEALLAGHPGHTGPVASRLALLFEAGRDFARASDFFLVAAQNAGRMYAADQAIALARRSIENAARLEGAARESRVMAAALHSAAQHQSATRLAAAAADFEVAERAAQALDDPVAEVDAIFGQANVCFVAKRIPEVKALGLRAMAIARTSGRPAAVAASTAILAFERVCTGDVSVGERQFDEAIPVLRESGKVNQALSAVLMRGLLRTWRLEHAGADADLEWARATAAERKAPFELLLALWHQARARGNQGRLSDAWDLLDEGLRLADLLGDRFCRPRIANTRGWILAELLDTEAALRLDTEAVRVARECADVEAECNSRINAARDYLALAEPQNALVHLQDAEARYQNEAWFRWVYYPRLHAELGAYWLAQGDLGRAETSARISLDGAGRTSSRKRIVSAHKLLGDIALLEDRPADARREFAAALAVLERHRCPTLEWHVLRSAAGAAAALDGDQARHDMLARSRSVVRSLAGSIRHPDLEATFLRSKPIRDLLSGSAF